VHTVVEGADPFSQRMQMLITSRLTAAPIAYLGALFALSV